MRYCELWVGWVGGYLSASAEEFEGGRGSSSENAGERAGEERREEGGACLSGWVGG